MDHATQSVSAGPENIIFDEEELDTLLRKMEARSSPRQAERNKTILHQWLMGNPLQWIGDQHGLTRERTRQVIKKSGVASWAGGRKRLAAMKKELLLKEKDKQSLEKHGMSYTEYRSLLKGEDGTYQTSPVAAYQQHRRNAGTRNISWFFSLATWWKVWEESGKWFQRGIGEGKYVMARTYQGAPYRPDTVEIVSASEAASRSTWWWQDAKK